MVTTTNLGILGGRRAVKYFHGGGNLRRGNSNSL